MKFLIMMACFVLSGCASTRVLVKDCQDLAGTDQKNCELVRKL